jgi:hypothetical protein
MGGSSACGDSELANAKGWFPLKVRGVRYGLDRSEKSYGMTFTQRTG